jgi:phosphoadenosine phosphosulfate reductase
MKLRFDLVRANATLKNLSPIERIIWSYNLFGDDLYALTSAGVDSALLLEDIYKSKNKITVLNINTGFLPSETLKFRDKLQKNYGFKLIDFGPTKKEISDINNLKLWDQNLELYSHITKLDPLTRAIKELNIKALLTGIRSGQTENRSKLNVVGLGNDGELRIRPFIDWTEERVDEYFKLNKLPRNSLYKKGFGSVGDIHTTKVGSKREGRKVMECGLHIENGKLVKGTI